MFLFHPIHFLKFLSLNVLIKKGSYIKKKKCNSVPVSKQFSRRKVTLVFALMLAFFRFRYTQTLILALAFILTSLVKNDTCRSAPAERSRKLLQVF